MLIKEAIIERFKKICNDKKIKYNQLANLSGVTPSTVYSMMNKNRKDLSVITLKKLCDGLEITLSEFFSTKEFYELEQEIQ